MKNSFFLVTLVLMLFSTSVFAIISSHTPTEADLISVAAKAENFDLKGIEIMHIQDFLTLRPSTVKEKTGRVLSWSEIQALKKTQSILSQMTSTNNASPVEGEKSKQTALLLCIFLGALGIHRFYTGHIGIGIIQLLTLGGCGIWTIIDLIKIIQGTLKTKDGKDLV